MVPITAEQFADAALRESWIRDKGMQVLQFWSDQHIETPVYSFVTEPFPFEEEYEDLLSSRCMARSTSALFAFPR